MLGVIFLALVAAPRAGWASCGDYLRHMVRSTADDQSNRDGQDRPLRPAPCHGPHCSARTPAPAVPAAPQFTPAGPRHQGYWLVQAPVNEIVVRWKLDETSDLHTLILAGRLFRPPRAS
jgi:hypothetical protein